GTAAGGALQYRMLVQAGADATKVGTGLTASSLISAATLFALPILSVPAVLAGRPVPGDLAQAAWLGGGVFVLAFALGGMLLVFVEAGVTALLVVAGVDAGKSSIAVLAYRLVSYWLPIPAGGVAVALHRRRYGDRHPVVA